MNTIDFVIPWTTLTVDSEDIAYIDYAVNVTVHELATRLTNTFTAWSPVWYSLATTLISDYPQWFDGSISLQDTRLSTVKVHNNYDSMPSHVDVPTTFPTIQPTDTVLNKGTNEIGIMISKGELIAIVLSVSLFCVLPLMLAIVHFMYHYGTRQSAIYGEDEREHRASGDNDMDFEGNRENEEYDSDEKRERVDVESYRPQDILSSDVLSI